MQFTLQVASKLWGAHELVDVHRHRNAAAFERADWRSSVIRIPKLPGADLASFYCGPLLCFMGGQIRHVSPCGYVHDERTKCKYMTDLQMTSSRVECATGRDLCTPGFCYSAKNL